MSKKENYQQRYKKRTETQDRHASMFCRTIEVKICENKLSKTQKRNLLKLFYEAKCYYNWLIADTKNRVYSKGTENITKITKLNKHRKECNVQIKVLSSNARQKMISTVKANIKTLNTLKQEGYQKPGKLKFKSQKNVVEYKHPKNDIVIKWDKKDRIKIPGVGLVRVRGLHQIYGFPGVEIANARLIRRATGYFVQFITFWPKEYRYNKLKKVDTIGVDLGCSNTVTFSNGKKIDVRFGETERLKRLQKSISRKKKCETRHKKRSKSYYRDLAKLQKEYQKLTNKRQHAANQIIGELRKYTHVVSQDDPIHDWYQNGHGRAVQWSCLGTVKRKFKEDPEFVTLLSQWEPTSKTCTNCGEVHDELTLDDRVFECSCGVSMDRDVHAACNMVEFYNYKLGTKHTEVTRVERVAPADRNLGSSSELVLSADGHAAYPRWSLKDVSFAPSVRTLKVPCL